MFSTSDVYFHRQNTLNLTNTNLGRRGKNNNPFQRDSYLQNINTILCIVIKNKKAFNIGMYRNSDFDWLKRLGYTSIHFTVRLSLSTTIVTKMIAKYQFLLILLAIIFTLPFTTSVTILISILHTLHSWAATPHLRPPMAFLSHNSSDTPGLALLMNVLFWGRCDFPISFSGRDM